MVDAYHAEKYFQEAAYVCPRDGSPCRLDPSIRDSEFIRQLATADRILLNKKDLVSKDQMDQVIQSIRSVNQLAKLEQTENARVPLDFLLDIKAYDLTVVPEVVTKVNAFQTATSLPLDKVIKKAVLGREGVVWY